MFRLKKNNSSSRPSNQAQTAIEYMLLLSTVTVIILLAFNGDYLGRVYNAANLYFDRTVVGIYGDGSACGDLHCEDGIENVVGQAFCPIDCPTVPIPTAGDCNPPHTLQSGPCTIPVTTTVKDGTSLTGSCSAFGCSGNYRFQCVNGLLTSVFSVECTMPSGPGAFCAPANVFHIGPQCSGIVSFSQTSDGSKATGNCPGGCTGGPVEISCDDGDFLSGSMIEVSPCVPGTPPTGATCPRQIYPWNLNGCSGDIILNNPNLPVPDGQDVQANCPFGPGCTIGSIGATCNNGTFDNIRELRVCSVGGSLDCPAGSALPPGTCTVLINFPHLSNGQSVSNVNCPLGCVGTLATVNCVDGSRVISGTCTP